MSEQESLDHRIRRLERLTELIEAELDEGWVFVCLLGDPLDKESVNLVGNINPDKVPDFLQMVADFEERFRKQPPNQF